MSTRDFGEVVANQKDNCDHRQIFLKAPYHARLLMAPEQSTATIVLLGRFIPEAFLPDILSKAKIISQKEAKAAEIRALLHGLVVKFSLAWADVSIEPNRIIVASKRAPYVRICDFVTKSVYELPTRLAVTAIGVNLESHYRLTSPKARLDLGRRLAPPEQWGEWGKSISTSMDGGQKNHGGMILVQMRENFEDEEVVGWLDVSVGPSLAIEENKVAYLKSNHHHQLRVKPIDDTSPMEAEESALRGTKLIDVLAERFESSIAKSESIFQGILESK